MEQISLILRERERASYRKIISWCLFQCCHLRTLLFVVDEFKFSPELTLMSLTIHPPNKHPFSLFIKARKIFFNLITVFFVVDVVVSVLLPQLYTRVYHLPCCRIVANFNRQFSELKPNLVPFFLRSLKAKIEREFRFSLKRY